MCIIILIDRIISFRGNNPIIALFTDRLCMTGCHVMGVHDVIS